MAAALPLVSIITPSFNQGEFIAATIDSVLTQDYPAIEYLVVDGGSTDGTLDVLRSYGARLNWISEPDQGQADAVNKGIARTQGAIVAWLNADDLYVPGAVARGVAELEAHPNAALVYGNAEFIDRAGTVLGPCPQVEPFDLARLLHHLDFIVQPATFFRRAAFERVGGLDVGLRYCLDYDLWLRLARQSAVRYSATPLAQARIYPETKTASGGLARLDEIERMVRRYGRNMLPNLFYGEMVRTCWHSGWHNLAARRWGRAASDWRRGLFYTGAYLFRKVRYGR